MILITGATGFIGKKLVEQLSNNYKIRCFVLKGEQPIFLKKLNNVDVAYGNLLDKDSIRSAMYGIKLVIHLAAVVGSANQKLTYDVNYFGTKNLIEVMKEQKIKKIIVTSSVAANFKHLGAYGKSKRDMENLFLSSDLDFIIIKPTLIYGKSGLEFEKIVNYTKKFPILPIIGNGKAKKQPIYIDDVISFIVTVIKNNKYNRKLYNLAGSTIIDFNEFVDLIYSQIKNKSTKKLKFHLPNSICLIFAPFLKVLKHPPFSKDQILEINEDATLDYTYTTQEFNFKPKSLIEGLKLSL